MKRDGCPVGTKKDKKTGKCIPYIIPIATKQMPSIDIPRWHKGVPYILASAYAQIHKYLPKDHQVGIDEAAFMGKMRSNPDGSLSFSTKKDADWDCYKAWISGEKDKPIYIDINKDGAIWASSQYGYFKDFQIKDGIKYIGTPVLDRKIPGTIKYWKWRKSK